MKMLFDNIIRKPKANLCYLWEKDPLENLCVLWKTWDNLRAMFRQRHICLLNIIRPLREHSCFRWQTEPYVSTVNVSSEQQKDTYITYSIRTHALVSNTGSHQEHSIVPVECLPKPDWRSFSVETLETIAGIDDSWMKRVSWEIQCVWLRMVKSPRQAHENPWAR